MLEVRTFFVVMWMGSVSEYSLCNFMLKRSVSLLRLSYLVLLFCSLKDLTAIGAHALAGHPTYGSQVDED